MFFVGICFVAACAASANAGSPLYEAIKKGDFKLVKSLVEKGADVNEKIGNYGTPLVLALDCRKFDIAKFLVEKGADVNGKVEVTFSEVIDDPNAEPDSYATITVTKTKKIYFAPLKSAANTGNLEMVKYLVERGADVNLAYCDTGSTPLHSAVRKGPLEVVRYLVEKG
ncbi:MAG: ankyrin repeat domain-containing protein, partial [Planctomycetaceae bacterium]|nr:ankyrin repeat domain-containing protein [Planctomycetaceae bacterium]